MRNVRDWFDFCGYSFFCEAERKYYDGHAMTDTWLVSMYVREKLLVSHRAPPKIADRGTLARYGGYGGNKVPGVDQN